MIEKFVEFMRMAAKISLQNAKEMDLKGKPYLLLLLKRINKSAKHFIALLKKNFLVSIMSLWTKKLPKTSGKINFPD